VLVSLTCAACFFISKAPHDFREAENVTHINDPVKAHLTDGSVIVFSEGFSVGEDFFYGRGIRFDLARSASEPVDRIETDSVAFVEYYVRRLQEGPFWGGLGALLVFGGAVGSDEEIAKAIFGSCPTVYGFDGEQYFLEAECFSYSIAPWCESTDLDRLNHVREVNEGITLKLVNEAFETHYINTFSLLEVEHPPGYEAYPTPQGDVVLFGKSAQILTAKNRLGQDVIARIAACDEQWYESDSVLVQQLTQEITEDWVEVEVPYSTGSKRMIVALRLRNTLMNTVFFYDELLKSQGVRAIEFFDADLTDLYGLWRLGKWYRKHFGLRIEVHTGREFKEIAHIGDCGPITWKEVAVDLPAPEGSVVRLRFSSLPGNWAIDWIGISFDTCDELRTAIIEPAKVHDAQGGERTDILSLIRSKDDRYLTTFPRDAYLLEFALPELPQRSERSLFIQSCGFYIEWLRHAWFAESDSTREKTAFQIGDDVIHRTAEMWLGKRDQFQAQFFSSRLSKQYGEEQR
jgi:hypothetical protein